MAKNPVTDAELSALEDRVLDLVYDLSAVADRVEKNLSLADDVLTPIRYAMTFAGLSEAATKASRKILVIASNAEDRAILEAKLKGGL